MVPVLLRRYRQRRDIAGRALVDHPAHIAPQRLDAVVRHAGGQGVHVVENLRGIAAELP